LLEDIVAWIRRLFNLTQREDLDRNIDREMAFHIDEKIDDLIASGKSREEASMLAKRAFGNRGIQREKIREVDMYTCIESIGQDVRFAIRHLYKTPVFLVTSVLILAIGIGATTAIFNVVNAVLLKPLPILRPGELRQLEWTIAGRDFLKGISLGGNDHLPNLYTSFSYSAYTYLRDRTSSFSDLICFDKGKSLNINTGHSAVTGSGQLVSGNFFQGLGVHPFLGRMLLPSDERFPDDAWPVVASYAFWHRELGGNPAAIGQIMTVNGAPAVLVGVTPPDYRGPIPILSVDLLLPITMQPVAMVTRNLLSDSQYWGLLVFGRIKPTVRDAQARTETETLLRQVLEVQNTAGGSLPHIEIASASHGIAFISQVGFPIAALLMTAVSLALLVTMSNLASLVLARSSARSQEIGARLALGAKRGRIIQQLLTENILISLAGGAFGMIVVFGIRNALQVVLGYLPPELGVQLDMDPDWRVFVFAAAISVATALVFGLSPSFKATKVDLLSILKFSRHDFAARSSGRFQRVLIAVQVAASMVLLAAAGMVFRTVANLQSETLGFHPENVITFRTDPTRSGYNHFRTLSFYEEAVRQIEAQPGIRSASVSQYVPLTFESSSGSFVVDGFTPQTMSDSNAYINAVSPHFFESLGIPVLAGRDLQWTDREDGPGVVVINQTAARHFFHGDNPIGREIQTPSGPGTFARWTIVGIVGDAKFNLVRNAVPPTVYFSYRKNLWNASAMAFIVRTAADPHVAIPMLQKTIAGIDPNVPVAVVKTAKEFADLSTLAERTLEALLIGLALPCLMMACIGIYGTLAYAAVRRTAEFGIRMALGAPRENIVLISIRESLVPTATGVLAGILISLLVGRALSAVLFGVAPADPPSLLVAACLLLVSSSLAGLIPARRASRIDPMAALRHE
jgi:predicted permease